MSKWLVFLLTGLALLAGATRLALAQQSAARRLPETPPPTVRMAHNLGVNVALEGYSPLERDAALDAMAAAGFGWVRQRLPWEQIEASQGQFDWAVWDQIVAAVDARGLELVAVLDSSPAWARAPEDAANPLAPPASRADFGRFAAAVAQRYGATLRFYQIWDEPNIAPHWGHRYVDAASYMGLLREGAVQVRSADPDALIMLAALAPTTEPGGLNQSDLIFLDALYAAGAAPWFDAAAAQPYGFEHPPDDPPQAGRLNFRRAELLAAVMRQHNDSATPLWLAAFGWRNTDGAESELWPGVDEPTQAAWTVEALEWARRHWDWAAGLGWAIWQPAEPAGGLRWGLALATPEGQPTAALAALSGWAQAEHPLGPGQWPWAWPAIQVDGEWRLTPAAADPPPGAALDNNLLRIPFEGSALALELQRGPYWGFLDVAIDGEPANALPRDGAGRANLLLYDPLGQQSRVIVARELADGPHWAEIRASGGWEQWPLLSLQVANLPAARWPGWLVGALWLAGMAFVAAGLWRRPRQDAPDGAAGPTRSIFAAAERAPAAVRYGLLAGLAALVVLGPGPLAVVALGLLFGLLVASPATGLALLAVAAPLFLRPLPLLGRIFNPAELVVWLLAAALGVRLVVDRVALRGGRARSETGPSGAEDGRARSETGPSGTEGGRARSETGPSGAEGGGRARSETGPSGAEDGRARSETGPSGADGGRARSETGSSGADGGRARSETGPSGADGGRARSETGPSGAEAGRWLALDWAVVALLAVALVSLAAAEHLGVALRELRTVIVAPVLAYGVVRLVPTGADGRFDPWPLVWGIGLGAAAVAGWGVYQAVGGVDLIGAEGVWRVRGPFGSPNNLALYLGHAWPLMAAVALLGSTRGRRLAAALLAALILLGLLLTFSKGALLLALPAALLFIGFAAGGRWRWVALGLIAAGALALLPLFATERFAGLLDLQGGTSFFRVQLWRGAWNMVRDHPWLGVGLDNFLYAYRTHYALPAGWQELNLSHPHNIVLDFWTRLGLPGLAVGVWLLAAAFWQGWRGFRRASGDRRALLLGLLAALAATLAHGLIDNSLFLMDLMLLFMLSIGLLVRLEKETHPCAS